MIKENLAQNFTLNQSFTFGYGSGVFNPLDKSAENPLYCRYEKCTRNPGNFKEECIRTAVLIGQRAAKLGRLPYIFLSGGMDSEVVVKAFMEAQIPFKAITFRFKNGLNAHETIQVQQFKKLGFDHEYYDLDILAWYRTEEAAKLFDESQCASFTLVPHMKLMNAVHERGGFPILGNGDVYLENNNGEWHYVELEYMLAWYRHVIKNKIPSAVGFFQFTPELVLSMLREPKMQALGRNLDSYANKLYETSRFIKYAVYKKYWGDLTNRPKYGGQERVRDQFAARSLELIEDRDPYVAKFKITYDELRSMLEPDEIAYRQGAVEALSRMATQMKSAD